MLGCVNVRDVRYWGCGTLGIRDVGGAGCWGCGMFGMWDVRDVWCLQGFGMLIYKMP